MPCLPWQAHRNYLLRLHQQSKFAKPNGKFKGCMVVTFKERILESSISGSSDKTNSVSSTRISSLVRSVNLQFWHLLVVLNFFVSVS